MPLTKALASIYIMVSVQELKAIVRDVIIVLIIGYALGLLNDLFLEISVPPTSTELWVGNIAGIIEGILIYTGIGIFAKGCMWKHMIIVALILFVYSATKTFISINSRIPIDSMNAAISILSVPFMYYVIVIGLGGLIASTYRKHKSI